MSLSNADSAGAVMALLLLLTVLSLCMVVVGKYQWEIPNLHSAIP